jgi:hypothetical protein
VGIFSGSKSSSTNSTTNNSSTSLGIDGDLSGILGDGNTLLNDNSKTDIYTDNSDNSSLDWYQDNSDNSSLDWQQDNSDNSIRDFEGQLAGANVNGNINITADGAFQFGSDVIKELGNTMQTALKNATEQTYLATKAAQESASIAASASSNAVRSVENVARDSVYSSQQVAESSIKGMLQNSDSAIKAATDSAVYAGETIGNAAEQFAKQNQATTAASIEAANSAMERNAALIQTTALGGQDLMIDAMKKVLMAGAAMMAVVFAVSAYRSAK